jgi:hypothetical protein
MEGWVAFDEENVEDMIRDLARKFVEITFIINDLLEERKKSIR